jgi:Z1 domain
VSNSPNQVLDLGERLVLAMLAQDRQPTPDEIAGAVSGVHGMLAAQGNDLDQGLLTKRIEAMVAVFQESSVALVDNSDHIPWLADAKGTRDWDFWNRYRRYLEDKRHMPRRVVLQLDQSTEEILGHLEDPMRDGTWRRVGLTIGQVQSGKTGHYIGLASKAVDSGYRLVVIMAGIHNDLRSQTQLRVDEGLLGFDTQYQLRTDQQGNQWRIGAGAMPGKRLDIASLTNSAEKGDFDRRAASKTNIPIGNFPVILVIKKHPKIIDYLRTWVTEVHGTVGPGSDSKIVRDVPLLLIDDEADNASIDVSSDSSIDPSKINAAIRRLMSSFSKASYVGYTATPYANVFIDPDADHDKVGEDLFPDSFIRTIRAPSNYLGPERVFGLSVDDPEEDDVEALPLVRPLEDYATWIPNNHKSSYTPPDDLPDSLRRAIDSFLLTCAARRARGQVAEHNSMLVHVTRFTAVQNRVREQVDEHVRMIADSLRDRYGQASVRRTAELQTLWEEDFVPTTAFFAEDQAPQVSWDAVVVQLLPALLKIQVRAINGTSKDSLEYYEHREQGLSVIAIGGNMLSRGLTLEGLSVSYYLRPAKTYDALLQMGRWFGYRPKYEDLCRLFTTPAIERAYVEITAATDELRREIEEMATLGLTPREFGLKVRASSLGLGITAANKMRQGTRVLLSYSGEMSETVSFNLSADVVAHNVKALEDFVGRLDETAPGVLSQPGNSVVWSGVSPEIVVSSFFDSYITGRDAHRVRPSFIAKYIRRCMDVGELDNWTVRLAGTDKSDYHVNIAGHEIGLITRKTNNEEKLAEGRYTIRRVLSPADESRDLDKEQYARAMAATLKAAAGKFNRSGQPRSPKVPTGIPLRFERRTNQPLLLIYPLVSPVQEGGYGGPVVAFAVSFPFSRYPAQTEYVVNSIWKQEDMDFDDDDEDVL